MGKGGVWYGGAPGACRHKHGEYGLVRAQHKVHVQVRGVWPRHRCMASLLLLAAADRCCWCAQPKHLAQQTRVTVVCLLLVVAVCCRSSTSAPS